MDTIQLHMKTFDGKTYEPTLCTVDFSNVYSEAGGLCNHSDIVRLLLDKWGVTEGKDIVFEPMRLSKEHNRASGVGFIRVPALRSACQKIGKKRLRNNVCQSLEPVWTDPHAYVRGDAPLIQKEAAKEPMPMLHYDGTGYDGTGRHLLEPEVAHPGNIETHLCPEPIKALTLWQAVEQSIVTQEDPFPVVDDMLTEYFEVDDDHRVEWLIRKLDQLPYCIENVDYTCTRKTAGRRMKGERLVTYRFSREMAKHIGLIDRSAKGHELRKKIIAMEERVTKVIQTGLLPASPEAQQALALNLVKEVVPMICLAVTEAVGVAMKPIVETLKLQAPASRCKPRGLDQLTVREYLAKRGILAPKNVGDLGQACTRLAKEKGEYIGQAEEVPNAKYTPPYTYNEGTLEEVVDVWLLNREDAVGDFGWIEG